MNTPRPLRYLNVFVVEEYDTGDGQKARRWIRVGAAFPHAEGPGFNLELQCLPRDGKLVVLAPNDEEDADPQSDLPLSRTPPPAPTRSDRSRPPPRRR